MALLDCSSLYSRLKLPKGATSDQIEAQLKTPEYTKLLKDDRLRPFIYEAERVLIDPTSRQKYDEFGLYTSGLFGSDVNQILDRLWLGNQYSAINPKVLEKGNIGSILSVLDVEPVNIAQFGVKHKYLYLEDTPHADLTVLIMECLDWIQQQLDAHPTQSVLVHCQAGASRSASVVIAYVMRTQKLDFGAAKKFVESKRPEIDPNSGFCEQLKKLTF